MDAQDLKELSVSIYDKLAEAIKEGHKEKALALLEEIKRNHRGYDEGFLNWVDILQTHGAEKVGEEFVYDTNRIFAERFLLPAFKGASELRTAEDRLKLRAYAWTSGHGINIDSIEEDQEKFILRLRCPTGGSIRLKKEHGKTKNAYPWSYGKSGLAYYCTHCAIGLEIMPIEEYGYPAWVCNPQAEGRCVQYLFKNQEDTPDEFYKRVGKEKKSVRKV